MSETSAPVSHVTLWYGA